MEKIESISIDIETYSDRDLKKCGVYKYAESPNAELLLFGYSINNGPVTVIDVAQGEEVPEYILKALTDDNIIKWAYNASFERIFLSVWLKRNYPQYFVSYSIDEDTVSNYLDPSAWRCSLVWGAVMGLPLSLKGIGAVLKLDEQKMSEGSDLIRYFCVPCKPTKSNGGRIRNLPEHAPEKWATFVAYRNSFFIPDRMNGQVVYSYKLRPFAEEEIYRRIGDITISMKALDHLKMPELIENRYPVYMDDGEKQQYESMKKNLILPYLENEAITAANAAALSGKLCQMANGAVYSDEGSVAHIHDRKLDALEDIIEAAQGPILLCYWFKHDLERITKKLDELKVEYARISSDGSIRMWNEGKFQVGLIHPASAGHGLNLQAGGNHIVWFGLTWSLELLEQTNARLWRQGQRAETVVVQYLVTAGTIDERILDAISKKEQDQNALIDAVKAEL